MGFHSSRGSPRSVRSQAALRASASPLQSSGLSQLSPASRPLRAVTRARAAALDCSEPSRRYPTPTLEAVAGSKGLLARSERLSVIVTVNQCCE